MESHPEPKPLTPPPITAQLVAIALALLAVFIATLLPQLLPPRLLDPQWQLTLCGVMAENGVLPLMALGLLMLASYLDPANLWVLAIRFISSELAGLAAMGFLLLIPLQVFTVISSHSNLELLQHQQKQRQTAQARLDALEQAIASAGSRGELNQLLQNLQAPPLPPSEQALPLSQLRPLLSQRVLRTRSLLKQQFSVPARVPLTTLVLQVLRGVVSNLAYALAFALAWAEFHYRR